ncbi:MAG: OmpA family protein [Alphaproteobacteria bacterium]|nr:OmpA family protein [Alphaproteobacteria bacterium]
MVFADAAPRCFVGNAVMMIGNPHFSRCAAYRLAILAVVLGLGACNPVDTWRDWTGASRNDPDPETTPNTQNLAAGEASDYPNLATVPPPPNRALTQAEREKLAQSLIADRANAKYSDEKLRAGFPAISALAPPPPPPPVPAATDEAQAKPAAEAAASAPATAAAANPKSDGGSAAPSSTATADSGTATGKTTDAPGQGLRKSGEPPEPPPTETSLEMPRVRSVPNPEQVQSSPPPPYPTPAPTAANAAPPTPHLQSPPAPAPMPQAIGSAAYQPPPPPPVLAPLANSGKSAQKPPPGATGTPVAEVKFAADSTALSDQDRQTLGRVVPLYQQNPGKLRVVGYAGSGSGAAEQLNSFRAALDRAQAVAAALTEAGIPADKIAVEAAPSRADLVESRAEVLLEH